MINGKPSRWALIGAVSAALPFGLVWFHSQESVGPAVVLAPDLFSHDSAAGAKWSQAIWADLLPEVAQGADPKPGTKAQNPARPGAFRRQQILQEYLRRQSMTPDERQQESETERKNEEEEWSNFLEFFKYNSPNRFAVLSQSKLPPDAPRRVALMTRWLNMQQMKDNQPDLYLKHVEQFQQEDRLFDLAIRLRRAKKNGNAVVAGDLEKQIGVEEGKLVDINLAERKLQIQHTKELLDQQQAKLAEDEANRVQLIAQQQQRIIDQALNSGPQANPVPVEGTTPEAAPVEAP